MGCISTATFVPPVAMILQYSLLDPHVAPCGHWMLSIFSVVYQFTVYAFRRYSRYLDTSLAPDGLVSWLVVYTGLILPPLAAFIFPCLILRLYCSRL